MPDLNTKQTTTQGPASYKGRVYYIGRRQLRPLFPVQGRVYFRRDFLGRYVVTAPDGRQLYRSWRGFWINEGWFHA